MKEIWDICCDISLCLCVYLITSSLTILFNVSRSPAVCSFGLLSYSDSSVTLSFPLGNCLEDVPWFSLFSTISFPLEYSGFTSGFKKDTEINLMQQELDANEWKITLWQSFSWFITWVVVQGHCLTTWFRLVNFLFFVNESHFCSNLFLGLIRIRWFTSTGCIVESRSSQIW